jgi:hypothetical protein
MLVGAEHHCSQKYFETSRDCTRAFREELGIWEVFQLITELSDHLFWPPVISLQSYGPAPSQFGIGPCTFWIEKHRLGSFFFWILAELLAKHSRCILIWSIGPLAAGWRGDSRRSNSIRTLAEWRRNDEGEIRIYLLIPGWLLCRVLYPGPYRGSCRGRQVLLKLGGVGMWQGDHQIW